MLLSSPREAAQSLGIPRTPPQTGWYRGVSKGGENSGGHYRIPESGVDSLLQPGQRPETPKRKMLRSLTAGRNHSTGRIVELKIEGCCTGKALDRGQIITSIITAAAAAGKGAALHVRPHTAALIKGSILQV